ncbi:MAG: hypothetical protein U0Q12_18820 [Vicinamibacterales bacterium]
MRTIRSVARDVGSEGVERGQTVAQRHQSGCGYGDTMTLVDDLYARLSGVLNDAPPHLARHFMTTSLSLLRHDEAADRALLRTICTPLIQQGPARSGRQTPQEVSWGDDIDTFVAADDQEVPVATHNQCGSGGDSGGEDDVIIGISGHGSPEQGGLNDSHAKSQLFQERDAGRTEREPPAQCALEFVEQGG